MTGRPPVPIELRKRREHGTNARYRWGEVGDDYRNGCRCYECCTAGVLYEKLRERRKARGIDPYVDNSEARQHLEWLETQGVGLRTVSSVSGVSRSALSLIRKGTRPVSRPETIAAIMAVHTGDAAAGAVIDGTRTMQLVDELLALGHTKGDLAVMLGASRKALQVCRRGTIRRETADKVTALYEELTRERDAQRQWDAERKADYRARRETGQLNYTRNDP
jgi:transcriptional regulator with XRE-family HTH domain